jgi:hypothetical protein
MTLENLTHGGFSGSDLSFDDYHRPGSFFQFTVLYPAESRRSGYNGNTCRESMKHHGLLNANHAAPDSPRAAFHPRSAGNARERFLQHS